MKGSETTVELGCGVYWLMSGSWLGEKGLIAGNCVLWVALS